MNKPKEKTTIPIGNRAIKRWIIGAVCVALLVSISTSWQTWNRNTGLASVTTLPIYFFAIWVTNLLWIGIAYLVFRWQKRVPMFSNQHPLWWLIHLLLSLLVGVVHLAIDTLILWLALSLSFSYSNGITEKLLQWLPYEVLAYWACLLGITLLANRSKIFKDEPRNFLERLSYKSDDETRFITVEQIDYIEACDNYVKVAFGKDRELIKLTMAYLENRLDPDKFMRIHRSFIINLDSLDKLSRHENSFFVVLNQGKSIPISRRRRAKLNKLVSK